MPSSSSSSESDSEETAARFASVAVDGETISTGAAAAAEASRRKSAAALEHRRSREETAGGRPAAARRAREQEEDEGNRLPPAVREKVRKGKEKNPAFWRARAAVLSERAPPSRQPSACATTRFASKRKCASPFEEEEGRADGKSVEGD